MRNTWKEYKKKIIAKWILYYFIVIVVYYMWFQIFYNMVAFEKLLPYSDVSSAISSILKNFFSISAVFIANTIFIFFVNNHRKTYIKVFNDALFSLLAVIIISMGGKMFMEAMNISTAYNWGGIILNDIIIFLFNEAAYLMYAYHKSVEKAKEAERLAIQLQYDVLKSQIDPHFLFNSLNILYSMSIIDAEKSREFILSLSQMYRYILLQHDKYSVKVKEELEFMQSYIDVLKNRYRNCLNFNVHGMEYISNQEIVPFSTQLLIENITKHNIIQSDMSMTVDIELKNDRMIISNPIRLKKTHTSSRIGLHYITEIYKTHNKEFKVTNDGTIFSACIPFL